MHSLIKKASPYAEASRYTEQGTVRSIGSWRTDLAGITAREFLDAAELVRGRLEYATEHEAENIEQLVDLTQDWLDLLTLAQRAGGDSVPAFAVVSTYDPNDTFRPGERAVWSGHFTREAAEAALPMWEAHLNRPRDPMVVEESWPTPVHQMRTANWSGPR